MAIVQPFSPARALSHCSFHFTSSARLEYGECNRNEILCSPRHTSERTFLCPGLSKCEARTVAFKLRRELYFSPDGSRLFIRAHCSTFCCYLLSLHH
ncbi:hypothetical protein MPTK1_8g11470 [Marchantia polymorpha subsp. ruderalis]|uniref:Uncharacterized protein n=1 Tax=Marchantia polymorpha TaxID=3197 RepID=A0A2R6XMG6_MARPO|nr:hypothetical protein MARPO_0008s0069 [Marchantia polymorpha]BBN19532.1 hypothetical protein Mp_8g11470 [Marchantia polymorpha subsp. ruderalis]|eukprot:PTQ47292.1 hypothetical protein MARPO_0008s0069 [Marchantia polymorpha]